jgi:hypothetical protein
MADCSQVHADLMRASRVQSAAQKIVTLEARQPDKGRFCRLATLDDCHALPVSRVASQRLVDDYFFSTQMPARQNRVLAKDAALCHSFGQNPMCAVIFGDKQQSRRLLVQTMDKPSPRTSTVAWRSHVGILTPAEERIHQGSGPVTRGRMHNHSGRFIDYKKVRIFVHHSERD